VVCDGSFDDEQRKGFFNGTNIGSQSRTWTTISGGDFRNASKIVAIRGDGDRLELRASRKAIKQNLTSR
jgi:hypothetical protein